MIYRLRIYICGSSIFVSYVFLQRRYLGQFVRTLIPSGLLVTISFGSMFVPPDQIPGRMTLVITTSLAIVSQSSGVFQSVPKTSYFKVLNDPSILCPYPIPKSCRRWMSAW